MWSVFYDKILKNWSDKVFFLVIFWSVLGLFFLKKGLLFLPPTLVKYRITGENKFLSLPKRGSDFRGYQTNRLKVWGYLMLGVPFPHCVLGVPVYLGVPKIFGGTSNLVIHPVG